MGRGKRWLSVERLEQVAREALAGGYGRMTVSRDGKYTRICELELTHNCTQPHYYELHARYSAQHAKRVKPLMIRGSARCRKCEACMDYKAWFWRTRAIEEVRRAPLTIFGTFTMSPEEHYRLDADIMRASPTGDMRGLSPQEVFTLRARAFGAHVTDFLKRVREGRAGDKPALRYLLVAEAHDGDKTSEVMRGRPHYHIMLHTTTPQALVSGIPCESPSEWYVHKDGRIYVSDTAWLRKQWTYGFTKFEMARDERAAWYVCKYISKALTCRVRASQRYGLPVVETKVTSPV